MKKFFIIITISLLCCLIFIPVKADTGWDTGYSSSDYGSSYGSGGSYGYGSSYSHSSSWSSSSHSSSVAHSEPFESLTLQEKIKRIITMIATFAFLIGGIVYIAVSSSSIGKKNKVIYKDISIAKGVKYGIVDLFLVKQELYKNFVDLQKAWMNFDYNTMRELCSDELYNTYKSQLDVLKLKKGQNIMKDFSLYDMKIMDAYQEGKKVVVKSYLSVGFYDYVINTETKEIIRGNDKGKVVNRYILTFVREMDKHKNTRCPNCGNKLKNSSSVKCEYCGSTIVKSSNKFVLTEKRLDKE